MNGVDDMKSDHWWPGPKKWIVKTPIEGDLGLTWVLEWGWTKRQALRRLERSVGAYMLDPPSWAPDDCAELLEGS